MDPWEMPSQDLAMKVGETLSDRAYQPFGEGDRHGSYEWTWWKPPDDSEIVVRFVTFSLSQGMEATGYRAEFWSGAQHDTKVDDQVVIQQFSRTMISRFVAPDFQDFFQSPLHEEIFIAARKASSHADSLTLSDLHETLSEPLIQTPLEAIKDVKSEPEI